MTQPAVGCVAAFLGASELTSHRFLDAVTLAPLLGGLATIVALVVCQYRAPQVPSHSQADTP